MVERREKDSAHPCKLAFRGHTKGPVIVVFLLAPNWHPVSILGPNYFPTVTDSECSIDAAWAEQGSLETTSIDDAHKLSLYIQIIGPRNSQPIFCS